MAFSIIQIHLKEKATINTENPEENTKQALMAISKEKFEIFHEMAVCQDKVYFLTE